MSTLSEQRRHSSLMKIRPLRGESEEAWNRMEDPYCKLILSEAKNLSVGAFL